MEIFLNLSILELNARKVRLGKGPQLDIIGYPALYCIVSSTDGATFALNS